MMKRVSCAVVLLAMVLTMALSGCAKPVVEYDQRVLKIAMPADLITADPATATGTPNHQMLFWVYNRLVQYNPYTAEYEADLAKSWEVNEDATVFTFHLRHDVYFHKDYGKMTSKDVKYSFERNLDPNVKTRYKTDFEQIERIETPDKYTVRIILKQPWVGFLGTIIAWRPGCIVSEQAVIDAGDQYGFNPVGTGPYVFESYTPREGYTLVANENYFKGKPRIPGIEVKVIPEETVAVMALEAGDVDMMIPRSGESYRTLLNVPGLNIVMTKTFGWDALFLNVSRPPLDDIRIRQAVQYAIDKGAMAEEIMEGLADADIHSVVPPGVFGHIDDVTKYDYDPEKARQLMQEAGYKGQEIEMIHLAYHRPSAIAAAAMLEEVGFNIKLTELESGAYYSRTAAGDYDIQRQGLTRLEADQYIVTFFHSKNIPPAGTNYSFYSNPEVDRLIDLQSGQADPAARAETLAEIQRIISQELPVALLYTPVYVTASVADLQGDVPNFTFWDIRPEYMWFGESDD